MLMGFSFGSGEFGSSIKLSPFSSNDDRDFPL